MTLCWWKKGSWTLEHVQENKPPVVKEDEVFMPRTGLVRHATKIEKDIEKIKIIKHRKEKCEEILLKEAFSKNEFIRNLLEGERLQAVVDVMVSRKTKAKEVIIAEGTVGTELYVSESGTYEIFIKGKSKGTFSDHRVFGELAILYDEKRQATIKVVVPGKLWILDQSQYQQLMFQSAVERQNQLVNYLSQVPKLNTVRTEILEKVSELLKKEFFPTGHVIIHEGESGDKFYIINVGTVTVSKKNEVNTVTMCKPQFFGQLALLTEDNLRQATVTANEPVECFSLSRQQFIDHFGAVEDITSIPELSERKLSAPIINQYQHVEFHDLKRIETIGVGAFGRVELVQHKDKKLRTFALKSLKKVHVVLQQQQKDVYNEKKIQMGCNSIFIPQMYKTFKDKKFVYFLMEICLGGDLWSLLQRQRNHKFGEEATKFYAASTLEALSYLHRRGIVYRDLKPENLLLDSKGYLKLTDFDFAKELVSSGKTYTFGGTPDYVAPEVILNKGHNQAVDYWALGILIFELLVGKTPFCSHDSSHMQTYNLILRGIERVQFQSVSQQAEKLIKTLCRTIPVERLGCQKDGPQAVKDHEWFVGFQWDRLKESALEAPFVPNLKNNTDTRYFNTYPKERDMPPDEESGWDKDF